MRLSLLAAALLVSAATPALAQRHTPTPVPMPPAIEAPQDTPYPGTIELNIDATDLNQAIFRMHERIPVSGAGPMTLLFPRWLPGDHSPSGQIEKFTGITMSAGGHSLAWRRDVVDISAFHVDVPAGADAIDLTFEFVSATQDGQGPITMNATGMQVQWNSLLLYPAGHYATQIMVRPQITLPEGWTYATALGYGTATSAPVTFAPVDLSTLVDSPMFAGRYARRIDLDPRGRSPVHLDLFADTQEALAATPAQIRPHQNLVRQADRLFGARHFDHYDFLLMLSDSLEGLGLEHHRSSENGEPTGYFTDWDSMAADRDLLPHEMTHSWNGKYRRPADLWTPNFNVPMRDSLLWVYEGQTQYWGNVLTARSGLRTRAEALDSLARVAAFYDNSAGRHWRPLQDTTNDPVIANRPPQAWNSWQRSEDYYSEGELIWLDVDTLIRERTHNSRSLDTFAHNFFGVHDGDWTPLTYTFEDVVAALNQVTPYDWASFLRSRLDNTSEHAPLDGLTRSGYRLAYSDTRSDIQKTNEGQAEASFFQYSLGMNVANDGTISNVMWDGVAFNQGLSRGSKIIAVNGIPYDGDVLRRAVTDAHTNPHQNIELIVQGAPGGRYRTITLDYHDGLRYAHLERIPGTPDRLTSILAPR